MGDGVVTLEPCSRCGRHVRTSERACPFCRSVLDFSNASPQLAPSERLSRSALMSFRTLVGAGVLGATTALGGCDDIGQAQAIYGAPCNPPDCGPVGGSGGSGAATGGAGGSGGSSDAGGESGAGGEGGS